MRHALATGALALVITAGWLWWFDAERAGLVRGEDVEPPPRLTAGSDTAVPTDGIAASGPTHARGPTIEVPPSLEGTEVDGYFSVVNGRFVRDANAIRVFEYFLSTRGEVSDAQIRALIEQVARAQVPPGEESAVMALYDDYLRYREALGDLSRGSSARESFEYVRGVQNEIFGDDAGALFGRDNRMMEYDLSRSEVMTDPSLDRDERQRRLQELDETLPAPLREMRSTMTRQRAASAVVDQMRQDGLSEEEVFEYRADEFGDAAAERLQALDERRAQWNARLEAYQVERDAILDLDLSGAEQAQRLDELRATHFEGPDRLRIEALDRETLPPRNEP
ncbi:MAG: lipase secretion chaperone [Myxococcota bacterium]